MADGFLGRWSRRKQEVREGKPVQDPAPVVPTAPAPTSHPVAATPLPGQPPQAVAPAGPAAPAVQGGHAGTAHGTPPMPTLEDAQALTPTSDFKPFVARAVSPEVRNLAMKKLFADPHFNVMDGLDIYVGDYTQPDPLPAGMLRKMASAHAMGFFDAEEKAGEQPAAAADSALQGGEQAQAIAPVSAQPRDDAEENPAPNVAQSGVCNAVPSVSPSEPEEAECRHEGAQALAASHPEHDHDAHLRLQPDDAPQRESVGRGTA